jgi:SpoVK/Ycf46/Vps4 family AAA+-type ATPase
VRDTLRTLYDRLLLRQRVGGREPVVAPHMLFLGPPGTGKTTVARLVGRMFQSLGLLPTAKILEVNRSDLVGGYVGQTAIRTREAIDRALGGVLFIDEAYSLAQGGPQDFGREAIDTLVAAMENERGRLVVISAGYPDAMNAFLDANEGLRSRFTVTVDFPNYPPEILYEILARMARTAGYTVDPAAGPAIQEWFRRRMATDRGSFANARTARNFLEQMEARLAGRVRGLPADADRALFTTLTEEDLPS